MYLEAQKDKEGKVSVTSQTDYIVQELVSSLFSHLIQKLKLKT